jgi:hypothetical protein
MRGKISRSTSLPEAKKQSVTVQPQKCHSCQKSEPVDTQGTVTAVTVNSKVESENQKKEEGAAVSEQPLNRTALEWALKQEDDEFKNLLAPDPSGKDLWGF